MIAERVIHLVDDEEAIRRSVGFMLRAAGLRSDDVKAGCAKCGACSALSTFESLTTLEAV